MAAKRPSFLKKLKEEQRRSRANEKREAKRARKQAKAERAGSPGEEFQVLDGPPEDSAAAADSEAE